MEVAFEEYWLTVVIVSARIAAFVFILPFLRGRSIPMMAKAIVILSIAAFVAFQMEPREVGSFPELLGILMLEVIIGFILAYIVEVLFSIVRIAGSLIDMDIGLANPFFDGTTNSQATIVSRMFYYIFLMIFIIIGGIEYLIRGFIYTYNLDIRAGFYGDRAFIDFMLETIDFMFFGALQIAIPFMMSTFLIYIALLLMTKSVDKINILMNIFGVKIFVGMVMITFCVPTLILVFQQVDDQLFEKFFETVGYIFTK